MKRLWTRLCAAWAAFRQPDTVLFAEQILSLWSSPVGQAAYKATLKTHTDPSFHPTKDHGVKRAESLEWAATYCREDGIAFVPWVAGLSIELTNARLKGRI